MSSDPAHIEHAVRIAGMIHRQREGEVLSAEGSAMVDDWRLRDPAHQDLWALLQDRRLLAGEIVRMLERDHTEAIDKVMARAEMLPAAGADPGARRRIGQRRAGLRRWMAAAALVVAAVGVWMYTRDEKSRGPEDPSLRQVAHEVPPGRNTAILTLANGSRVVLDSVQDGRMGEQGAAVVSKKDDALEYVGSGNASGPIVYNILSTPRGGQYSLRLPDGTMVWLDAESSIRYPTAFGNGPRRVDITGQAYFEVAANERAPFIVYMGDIHVDVLGTRFNINAYDDEGGARITLLEGAVRVSDREEQLELRPGQQAKQQGNHFSLEANADEEEAIAWKNGLFKFNDSDVPTILRQASRWYDIEVSYQGAPPTERFRGKLSRNSGLSQFLKILELSNVHFITEGRRVTILQNHP